VSLHYLVKLEMIIEQVLPSSCYRKILQSLYQSLYTEFISQLWPPNWPELNPIAYCMWGILQQKVYKILVADVDELKQRLRTEWTQLQVMSSLRQPLVSGVFDGSRSVMHVLHTFSCNIFHILLSTGFKSGEFGGHSW